MTDKEKMRPLRREFNTVGLTLLVYNFIMNGAVMLAVIMDVVIRMLMTAQRIGIDGAMALVDEYLEQSLLGNGWGYLLACLVGSLILLAWKKREFCFGTIWTRGEPMKPGNFFTILCVFSGGQLLFQVMTYMQELLLNQFGMSMMDSYESATVNADSASMFLYICLGAPIFEEVLFRGLILRSLLPYGKKFAILMSAIAFGVFHGNAAQTPYAFVVGLVLGYTAVEYSIGWAMVLHMFNNLLLADTMSRLLSLLPFHLGDLVYWLVIVGFGIAAVAILICKRRQIGVYLRQEKMEDLYVRSFFTAAANMIFVLYYSFNIVLNVVLSAI